MGHNAIPKQGLILSGAQMIDKLVRQNNIARSEFRLQGTDSRHAQYPFNTQLFKSKYIRSVVELAGQNPVAPRMSGKKCHGPALKITR